MTPLERVADLTAAREARCEAERRQLSATVGTLRGTLIRYRNRLRSIADCLEERGTAQGDGSGLSPEACDEFAARIGGLLSEGDDQCNRRSDS